MNGIINKVLIIINLLNLLLTHLLIDINKISPINNAGKNHVGPPIPNSVIVCIKVHFNVSKDGFKIILNNILTIHPQNYYFHIFIFSSVISLS